MEFADWKSLLELVGTIGLIAGLVLVAIQIHQNSVLVRAELSSNRHDAWIEIDSAKRSDNFSGVLSKAIEDPVNLSLADMIALEGYLLSFLAQLDREYVSAELKSFPSNPNKTVKENVELYMGNQFAQAWWSVQKLPIWRVFRSVDDSYPGEPVTEESDWDSTWEEVYRLRESQKDERFNCHHSVEYFHPPE